MSSVVSHAASKLPDIDDRLVEPEARHEMLDGELVHVSPADRPHARRHAKVIALLEAHAFAEFAVGCDQLTRASEIDDVAPDVSVYPDADDPVTGGRQLEQLAFEVVSTESLGHAAVKAAKLTARGVRRVFAIDIERSRALEWSPELGTWRRLEAAGQIEDAALELPLPIEAMLHAARADDEIARALVARHNPVIEAVRAEDRAAAKAEGKAEAVLVVLATRNVAVGDAERRRILSEQDPAQLNRWLTEAAICEKVAELFTTAGRP
ncbi:MAG TPA: Uma2 family endonuclease [Kofleriaceae bacterium]|jgi:Uma2 family endonuclease|nr:Uma2 family endonuclease [Kofleriaceae bacterium]